MTGNRAGLGAQTFLLPQPAPQQAAPVQQPYNDGVQALEGLQYVQGQTSDYYKKVADLKAFMQSVNQNLGIDVRVPDLSRPESLKLNEIYRNAIADIQAQGNALKTGLATQNLYTQMNQQYAPGIDPTAQPAGQLVQGQDVYSRNAEPSVTELNDKLKMPSYTEREHKDKLAAKQQLEAHYDKLIEQYPERKAYYEYQKSAIISPTQGDWRPQSAYQDRAWGKKVETAGNFLKKTSNLYLGTDSSYTPNENQIDEDGTPVLESKEFRGRKVGSYILEGWRFYPTSKRSTILIKDPKTGGVTEQEVTEQDAQTIAGGLGNVDINAMAEYTAKNKLVDDLQYLDKVRAAGFKNEEDYNSKLQENIGKSTAIYNHGYSMAVNNLDQQLASLKAADEKKFELFSIRQDDEVQLGKFKIKKTAKDTWEITNIKEVLPQGTMNAKEYAAAVKDKKTWDNLESLKTFLINKGYVKDELKAQRRSGEQPVAQPTTTTGTNSADTDPLGILQ